MSRRLWLSLRTLLHVHCSGDCGSPRLSGSTSARKSSSRLVSVTLSGLRPPPGRRTQPASGVSSRPQFGQSAPNSAARQAGRPHHRADPAAPGRYRLRRAKTPTTALVQHWRESLIPHPNRRFITHANLISCRESPGNPATQKNHHQLIHLFPDGSIDQLGEEGGIDQELT